MSRVNLDRSVVPLLLLTGVGVAYALRLRAHRVAVGVLCAGALGAVWHGWRDSTPKMMKAEPVVELLSWKTVGSQWDKLKPFERDWIVRHCAEDQLAAIVLQVLPGKVEIWQETFGFKYRAEALAKITGDFEKLSDSGWKELFRLGQRETLLESLVGKYLITEADRPSAKLWPGEYDELKRLQLLDDVRLVHLAKSAHGGRALTDLFAREEVNTELLCDAMRGFLINGGYDKKNVTLAAGLIRNYILDVSSQALLLPKGSCDLFKLPLMLCSEERYVRALLQDLTGEHRTFIERVLDVHLKEHLEKNFRPSRCRSLSPWTFCRLRGYGLLRNEALLKIVGNRQCSHLDGDEESRVWSKLLSRVPLTGIAFQTRRSAASLRRFCELCDSAIIQPVAEDCFVVLMDSADWCLSLVHGLVDEEVKQRIISLLPADIGVGIHTQPAAWALRLLFTRKGVPVGDLISAMETFCDVHGATRGSVGVAVQIITRYLRRDDVKWSDEEVRELVLCVHKRSDRTYERVLLEQFPFLSWEWGALKQMFEPCSYSHPYF